MGITEEMQCAGFFQALENQEFHVWYQPQVDLRSARICGAEALVRWQRADGTTVPPDGFIPDLERNGLILRLDQEVVEIVCRDLAEAKSRGIHPGPVSVNLSGLHQDRGGIVEKVCKTGREYGVDGRDLCFELTETAPCLYKGDCVSRLVRGLQEAGFQVSMDDYGTGCSTLMMLAETEFDILKLDRHFISRIGEPRTDIILESTILLARRLGMEVVAEGVESERQADFLREKGCFTAQGYYYFRPLVKRRFFDAAASGEWRPGYEDTL